MSTQPVSPRRIGVFGGAFDPPHRGHGTLVQAAVQHLALDVLLVVPTGSAWHKSRPLSAAQHRMAMSELAFGEIARVQVDGCEIRRAGPSYTVDTLRELHQRYPGAAFFLLMGQDQAQRLSGWSRAEALPDLATLCVAGRADPLDAAQAPAATFMGHALLAVPMPLVSCSSTAIREALAAGRDTGTMLDPAVARYIAQHLLYAPTFTTEHPD
jgi:nicotinate-nucleotide adenylyltransferase